MNTIEGERPDVLRQKEFLAHHCKVFAIREDPRIAAFRKLLECSGAGGFVECSVKLDAERVHATRLILWFAMSEPEEKFQTAARFARGLIEDHGGTFNDTILDAIVKPGFNFGLVQRVLTGVDLREESCSSRAKIWLIMGRDDRIFDTILALHGANDFIRELFALQDELLFGIDFTMDGRTSVKIYLILDAHRWNRRTASDFIGSALSPHVTSRMDQPLLTYVSFEPRTFDRTIHFFGLRDVPSFAANLGSPALVDLVRRVWLGGRGKDTISVSEKELAEGRLRRINFYHILTQPPEWRPPSMLDRNFSELDWLS